MAEKNPPIFPFRECGPSHPATLDGRAGKGSEMEVSGERDFKKVLSSPGIQVARGMVTSKQGEKQQNICLLLASVSGSPKFLLRNFAFPPKRYMKWRSA